MILIKELIIQFGNLSMTDVNHLINLIYYNKIKTKIIPMDNKKVLIETHV